MHYLTIPVSDETAQTWLTVLRQAYNLPKAGLPRLCQIAVELEVKVAQDAQTPQAIQGQGVAE